MTVMEHIQQQSGRYTSYTTDVTVKRQSYSRETQKSAKIKCQLQKTKSYQRYKEEICKQQLKVITDKVRVDRQRGDF